jgi:hypothetical protein
MLLKVHNPKDGVQKKSTAYQATLILLEEALILIRYSVERDRSWAIDIAEQIQRQIAEKVFKREVDIRIQADLIHVLYESGLELHPQIKVKSQEVIQYYSRFSARTGPPDIEKAFDALISKADGNPFEVYELVMAELNLLPTEGQLTMIGEMVKSVNPLAGEITSFMLRELLGNRMGTAVRPAFLESLIPHFIWLGQQQNSPPHPLLLHVAETMGVMYWLPQSFDFDDAFASLETMAGSQSLSPENITKVMEESGYWPAGEHFAASWFEDDARVDELLKENFDFPIIGKDMMVQAIGLILVEILQDKTDLWCERLLWMALWARSCKDRTRSLWRKFFIIARELHTGTPLYQIPLMLSVAQRSIYSALRRMEDWS